MSKPAARIGDMNSGHGCFMPTSLIMGSPTVLINGIPASRLGDQFATHCCPFNGCHNDAVTMGSTTVLINGMPSARVGDDAMGALITTGSTNVLIGG